MGAAGEGEVERREEGVRWVERKVEASSTSKAVEVVVGVDGMEMGEAKDEGEGVTWREL